MGMFPADFTQRHILKHLIDPPVAGRRVPTSDQDDFTCANQSVPTTLTEIHPLASVY
jgi:hypothetical protein